jgi:hygromycin-B 7''-O-kinase
VRIERPRLGSDNNYAKHLPDVTLWEPLARAALELVGLSQPGRLRLPRGLGTYPLLVSEAGMVVNLFGEHFCGPESYAAELDAYRILQHAEMRVARLLAHGELFPSADNWPWPFLVISRVPGRALAECASLESEARHRIASDCGRWLSRLHALPLVGAGPLQPDWRPFMKLLERRRRDAPADHGRWGDLPRHLVDQLDAWLPSPTAVVNSDVSPRLLHADLHDQHLFVDPCSSKLEAAIDFTDALAGDPRYDLVALHMGSFRANKRLLRGCLDACGWSAAGDGWAREMLVLTLLHDFNMFDDPRLKARLEQVATLDVLAEELWGLST